MYKTSKRLQKTYFTLLFFIAFYPTLFKHLHYFTSVWASFQGTIHLIKVF